mmetsp:Transcript_36934/g.56559  ORF Transcript_36934/g.56559 Transcript_36934/m.56559 type:complete len:116 (+) Transcript_36934:2-349(+)
MDSDKEQTIAELEAPRFLSCSFYPYSLNEESEVVVLLRNKKGSKNPDFYVDFGTSYKETDPCILYSAARSFLKKCGGLCLASEIQYLDSPEEVQRILKETCQRNTVEIFENIKIK